MAELDCLGPFAVLIRQLAFLTAAFTAPVNAACIVKTGGALT
ncbi:hypothetical protein V5F40_08055 [Xanthobacter sp. DSM 14520]